MRLKSTFDNTLYNSRIDKSVVFNKLTNNYKEMLAFATNQLKEVKEKNNNKSFIIFDKKDKIYEMYLQLFTDNQIMTIIKYDYKNNIKEKLFFYYYDNRSYVKYLIFQASNPAYVLKDETVFSNEELDMLDVKITHDGNKLQDVQNLFEELSQMVQ